MTADRPYFRHDPDLLRQRPAASRPRLYDGGLRCAGALHAARRAPRQVPDRHRRARPEGRAIGAARRACRRRNSPTGFPAAFRDMAPAARTSATTISSAPPSRATSAGVQAMWQELERRGEIYLGRFAGWYSVRDEAFYDESELRSDGQARRPAPRSNGWRRRTISSGCRPGRTGCWPVTTRIPMRSRRAAGATRSSALSEAGCSDLSISRTSFSWGIPVPGDPQHVIYVWLDALTNYITALGYPETESAEFSTFWPADLHMVGKDILRFHAVYWPAFLMAAGLEPPRRVFAHGWWTVEGQKMSKSLGNFIPPKQLVDRYGLDPVRYFLLRELPFGSDGDFSHRAVVGRLNGDLANDFGNLAQRVLVDDQPQLRCAACPSPASFRASRRASCSTRRAGFSTRVRPHVSRAGFPSRARDDLAGRRRGQPLCRRAGALGAAAAATRRGWRTVLYSLAETLRHLAILVQPFVPERRREAARPAGGAGERRGASPPSPTRRSPPGTRCQAPEGIFPRFVEEPASADAPHGASRPSPRGGPRAGWGRHAGRQPLPSRFPGFRRRARCGGRPRPRRRRRHDADDRHAARPVRRGARDRRGL